MKKLVAIVVLVMAVMAIGITWADGGCGCKDKVVYDRQSVRPDKRFAIEHESPTSIVVHIPVTATPEHIKSRLSNIPGIAHVFASKDSSTWAYEWHILLAATYEWGDVECEVISILRSWLGQDLKRVALGDYSSEITIVAGDRTYTCSKYGVMEIFKGGGKWIRYGEAVK